MLLEKENGQKEVVSSESEFLESSTPAQTSQEGNWVDEFDNKKELLEVLNRMEIKAKEGEEVNEVNLQAVLNDFKDRLESGNELVSVAAELIDVEDESTIKIVFAITGIACAFLMFLTMYVMLRQCKKGG